MSRFIPLALLIVITACSAGGSRPKGQTAVTLSVSASSYAPEDTVELRLENRSEGVVMYNLCANSLSHLQEGEWAVVPSHRVCTMELRSLATGEIATYPVALPGELAAGTYRFSTGADLAAGDQQTITTKAFEVR